MTLETLIDDLLTELQVRGFGTVGVDLFDGGLNSSVENCISITPYEGTNPSTVKSGEENPYNPYLSVLIRNRNKKQAYLITVRLYKMWRLVPNVQIGNTKFELIKARGTFHPLGVDKMGLMNYSVNFSLKFE
jgi:hypothetical protein